MNCFLLTPYFLDEPAPALRALARNAWSLNEPAVRDGDMLPRLAAINEGIAAFTEQSVRSGARPVCVTGDCCAALGAIAGLQRAGLAARLLWLDAHGDFNTPQTTPSGFVGGMPLAMLTGRGDQTILNRLSAQPLDDDAVVLCDARDLDPLERHALASSRIVHLSSIELLERFEFGSAPVHLHLDPDIINPKDAPAMLYATSGGPTADVLAAVLAALVRRVRIVSITLTTWAVDRDSSGATEASVWKVVAAALDNAGASDAIRAESRLAPDTAVNSQPRRSLGGGG